MIEDFIERKNHHYIPSDESKNFRFIVARTRNQRTDDLRIYAIPCSEAERIKCPWNVINEAYLLTQGWRNLDEAQSAFSKYGGVLVRKVSSRSVLEDLSSAVFAEKKTETNAESSLTCNVHGSVPYSNGYCPFCEGGNENGK